MAALWLNFSGTFFFLVSALQLGSCDLYMTPTLDVALLISSSAGTDPGLSSDSGV